MKIKKPDKNKSRRKALQAISSALVAGSATTEWVRPVIQAVVLPVHAGASIAFTCEINFQRQLQISAQNSGVEIPKIGTSSGDIDIEGTYIGFLPGADSSLGNCSDPTSAIGFNPISNVTITVERLS